MTIVFAGAAGWLILLLMCAYAKGARPTTHLTHLFDGEAARSERLQDRLR